MLILRLNLWVRKNSGLLPKAEAKFSHGKIVLFESSGQQQGVSSQIMGMRKWIVETLLD